MKLEIYKKKEEEEKLKLNLVKYLDGSISLHAVDNTGRRITTLLTITTEGKLELSNSINESLGLDLDKYGKLKVH